MQLEKPAFYLISSTRPIIAQTLAQDAELDKGLINPFAIFGALLQVQKVLNL